MYLQADGHGLAAVGREVPDSPHVLGLGPGTTEWPAQRTEDHTPLNRWLGPARHPGQRRLGLGLSLCFGRCGRPAAVGMAGGGGGGGELQRDGAVGLGGGDSCGGAGAGMQQPVQPTGLSRHLLARQLSGNSGLPAAPKPQSADFQLFPNSKA